MAAFYPCLVWFFYSFAGRVRWDRFLRSPLLRTNSEINKIVYRMAEILFAAEIVFCGLDRCMTEQELNLFKLPTTVVTQLRAGSPQVVRCNVL